MRKTLFIIITLFCAATYAQKGKVLGLSSIQEKTNEVPSKYKKDPDLLGHYLAKDQQTDGTKVMAISYWMAMPPSVVSHNRR